MDESLDENQYGFRKGKSTAQPFFILRRTQEIQEEAALECHLLLLGWEKTFDKVLQDRMTKAIKRLGIPDKIINMINEIYREPNYTIGQRHDYRPKNTESGNKTRMSTIPISVYHAYDCHYVRR